jgi:tRNA dimethylallyltransferase
MDAEILSVDSMQVYRGMDVGTAKPTILERKGVAHHMVDVVEPEQEFSVAEFRRMARRVVANSARSLIVTGGSGLHFRAVVDPMSFAPTDPGLRADLDEESLESLTRELSAADERAEQYVDLANKRRVVRAVEIYRLTGETPSRRAASAEAGDVARYVPELEFTAVGVDAGERIEERIDRRIGEMRSGGLVSEVRGLSGRLGRTAAAAVGYKEILDLLAGRCVEEEAFEAIGRSTKRLAKKQRTWFQRDPRVRWIPWSENLDARVNRVLEILE